MSSALKTYSVVEVPQTLWAVSVITVLHFRKFFFFVSYVKPPLLKSGQALIISKEQDRCLFWQTVPILNYNTEKM